MKITHFFRGYVAYTYLQDSVLMLQCYVTALVAVSSIILLSEPYIAQSNHHSHSDDRVDCSMINLGGYLEPSGQTYQCMHTVGGSDIYMHWYGTQRPTGHSGLHGGGR